MIRRLALVTYWALAVASLVYLAVAVAWWSPIGIAVGVALMHELEHLGRKR